MFQLCFLNIILLGKECREGQNLTLAANLGDCYINTLQKEINLSMELEPYFIFQTVLFPSAQYVFYFKCNTINTPPEFNVSCIFPLDLKWQLWTLLFNFSSTVSQLKRGVFNERAYSHAYNFSHIWAVSFWLGIMLPESIYKWNIV